MPDSALCWIDTHVHWDAVAFDGDRDVALRRARRAGVTHCLNPSVTAAGFEQVRQLAAASCAQDEWPRILPAYGIHPMYAAQCCPDDLEVLAALLTSDRPVAVGEIGLDATTGAPDMATQLVLFEAQLALAKAHQLPVLLHVRHAVEAVIQSLKRVFGKKMRHPGGIAHAFNGSLEQAQQLVDMGFLLGFGGAVTYDRAHRIRRLAEVVSLDALVLETDAPDMSPRWSHGQRNESAQLPAIGGVVAELRGIETKMLAESNRRNVHRLMGHL